MSRVGQQSIEIPQGVEVAVTPPEVVVKGPRGELKVGYRAERITVESGESTGCRHQRLRRKAVEGIARTDTVADRQRRCRSNNRVSEVSRCAWGRFSRRTERKEADPSYWLLPYRGV